MTGAIAAIRALGPVRRACAALALSAALGACESSGDLPRPCPELVGVQDASSLVKFTGAGRDLTDVLFESQIEGTQLSCVYDDEVIESLVNIRILAVRGPADEERLARLRYFVAITTNDLQVVAREEFEATLPFEGARTRIASSDEIEPRIPLRPGTDGDAYRIYFGLILTPDELRYNRENR